MTTDTNTNNRHRSELGAMSYDMKDGNRCDGHNQSSDQFTDDSHNQNDLDSTVKLF